MEDKEIVQLQNMSTDIEKINRKEIDDVESDKSDTEERDKIQISDEVIIPDRKKDDDDDQVNKDADQGTSEEEQEEKDQTERSKRYALESDISEPGERDQRDKNEYLKGQEALKRR